METPPLLAEFAERCNAALATETPREAIHAAMCELFDDPAAIASAVPQFDADEVPISARGFRVGGEHIVHQSQDLTVMVLDTLPGVLQPPHNHEMVAIIGVFEGCEDQRFWRQGADGPVPTPGRSLTPGDVMALGERAIHAISSPPGKTARAIHVYLGDIYDVDRSIFHPETLEEMPMTSERYDEFCRSI